MFRNPGQFARCGGAYEHHLWSVSKRNNQKGGYSTANIMRLMSRGYFESCTVENGKREGHSRIVSKRANGGWEKGPAHAGTVAALSETLRGADRNM